MPLDELPVVRFRNIHARLNVLMLPNRPTATPGERVEHLWERERKTHFLKNKKNKK